jgi:hypothetical protein
VSIGSFFLNLQALDEPLLEQECTYRSIRTKGILHQRLYERIQAPLLVIAYTLLVDVTSMGVGLVLRSSTQVRIGKTAGFTAGARDTDTLDVWIGVETHMWRTLKTGGETTLPPLRAHTTTLVGKTLYVFGGGDGPTYSNDVYAFDTCRFSIAKTLFRTFV